MNGRSFLLLDAYNSANWQFALATASRLPRSLANCQFALHPSQNLPWFRAAVTSLLDHDLAVDDHVIDSGGVLLRPLEGRAVGDGLLVKDHYVGGHSRPQQAAIP